MHMSHTLHDLLKKNKNLWQITRAKNTRRRHTCMYARMHQHEPVSPNSGARDKCTLGPNLYLVLIAADTVVYLEQDHRIVFLVQQPSKRPSHDSNILRVMRHNDAHLSLAWRRSFSAAAISSSARCARAVAASASALKKQGINDVTGKLFFGNRDGSMVIYGGNDLVTSQWCAEVIR